MKCTYWLIHKLTISLNIKTLYWMTYFAYFWFRNNKKTLILTLYSLHYQYLSNKFNIQVIHSKINFIELILTTLFIVGGRCPQPKQNHHECFQHIQNNPVWFCIWNMVKLLTSHNQANSGAYYINQKLYAFH